MTPPVAPLSPEERRDWVRLARSEGIGPRTFLSLLQRLGSAAAAIDAFPHLQRRRPQLRLADPAAIDRELVMAERRGLVFRGFCEPDYPPALRRIDAPPPVLLIRGQLAILGRPAVAIVGSRNASASGAIFAERLALELGQSGFAIASGLARGIDARAHRGSLASGTIAVLAGGHDQVYPPDHAGLAEEIAATGAVVSEMPLGWVPRARDFPRRNRIVSGVSLGTVVVEAARQSGSLITARFAAEQNRDVFAVPGSPLDPRAEGTNDLLRQGAILCARADDVVEALRPQLEGRSDPPEAAREAWRQDRVVWDFEDGDAEEPPLPGEDASDRGGADLTPNERIEALLGPVAVPFDDLARLAGVAASDLRVLLLDLELDGRVEWDPAGGVRRRPG